MKKKRKFANLTIVRIGNYKRPAGIEDINDFAKQIEKAFADENDPILVTHHAVAIDVVKIPIETSTIKILGVTYDGEFKNELSERTVKINYGLN